MEKSESIKNLAVALSKFQSEVPTIKKDTDNPYYKSKYSSLENIIETIRKPLADNGLSFSQFPTGEGNMVTILMHISGEWMSAEVQMKPKDNTPQAQGSAITYMRRYSLGAVLGLATDEDDDGNAASKPAPAKAKTPAKASGTPYEEALKALDACATLDDLAAFKAKVEASTKLDEDDKAKLLDEVTRKDAELKFVQ